LVMPSATWSSPSLASFKWNLHFWKQFTIVVNVMHYHDGNEIGASTIFTLMSTNYLMKQLVIKVACGNMTIP
jgi:hypothetical protein